MDEFSILIGGQAGFGIDSSSLLLAKILNCFGYQIYIYRDYPSIIRGGHTFSLIRVSKEKMMTYHNKVDFILALNQDSIDLHKELLKKETKVIFDSDCIKADGIGIPMTSIAKEEKAEKLYRNSCALGAICKFLGIEWKIIEEVFKKEINKDIEINLKMALRGFDQIKTQIQLKHTTQEKKPLLSGNQAICLGLIQGGLESYIAYPMTPSSTILHFMAKQAERFNLQVIHPESEISVMLMALGFSYAGKRVAIGTSGGGFCLMIEGLSLSGMAELPIVIIISQRAGPATGLPTYSGQSELLFAKYAGHGEFPRLLLAPGDTEEAYYLSIVAMQLSWKYQIPVIILADKTLSEGNFSFDQNLVPKIKEENIVLWDKNDTYKRYEVTENGISPLAFVPTKNAIIKTNSYEHDESGITTENANISKEMQDKRLKKLIFLSKNLEEYKTVNLLGNPDSPKAILCWGSNKGVCVEIAKKMNLRLIQLLVIYPFPKKAFAEAMKGVKQLISVEQNATGQLSKLIEQQNYIIHSKILKYDGRPFSLEDLEEEIKKVMI